MSDYQSTEMKFLYSEFKNILTINGVVTGDSGDRLYATRTKDGITISRLCYNRTCGRVQAKLYVKFENNYCRLVVNNCH